MMDIKEALRVVEKNINYPEDNTYGGMCDCDYISEALDTLKQSAEQAPHWISVKDRLPEEDGNYLAVMDGNLCWQKEPFVGVCGFEDGTWDYPNMVSYWMPLPEPPKEENNAID